MHWLRVPLPPQLCCANSALIKSCLCLSSLLHWSVSLPLQSRCVYGMHDALKPAHTLPDFVWQEIRCTCNSMCMCMSECVQIEWASQLRSFSPEFKAVCDICMCVCLRACSSSSGQSNSCKACHVSEKKAHAWWACACSYSCDSSAHAPQVQGRSVPRHFHVSEKGVWHVCVCVWHVRVYASMRLPVDFWRITGNKSARSLAISRFERKYVDNNVCTCISACIWVRAQHVHVCFVCIYMHIDTYKCIFSYLFRNCHRDATSTVVCACV
jgi:hypothetical protein